MTFEEFKEKIFMSSIEENFAIDAYKAGQLEAALKILEMWRQPWTIKQIPFIDNLKAYIEELKK